MMVSELKELARAATPGPWHWAGLTNLEKIMKGCFPSMRYEDTRYISRVDPQTVLALIERVEKLGEALKEISEVKDYGDSLYQGIGIHPLKNQIALNALALYGPDKELG